MCVFQNTHLLYMYVIICESVSKYTRAGEKPNVTAFMRVVWWYRRDCVIICEISWRYRREGTIFVSVCEMSRELLMKCKTILLKQNWWRETLGIFEVALTKCFKIHTGEKSKNWQWKTFEMNFWGGCYKVFQTWYNFHGTCWVFAKNDWNSINQMEALVENDV